MANGHVSKGKCKEWVQNRSNTMWIGKGPFKKGICRAYDALAHGMRHSAEPHIKPPVSCPCSEPLIDICLWV